MTAKIGKSISIVIVLGSAHGVKRCRRRGSIFFARTSETTIFRKPPERWTRWGRAPVSVGPSKSVASGGITPGSSIKPNPNLSTVELLDWDLESYTPATTDRPQRRTGD